MKIFELSKKFFRGYMGGIGDFVGGGGGRRVSTCALGHAEVCCADEGERAGAGWRRAGGTDADGAGASGAVLPELFRGIERQPVQAGLPAVRILFKLLGFLLSVKSFFLGRLPDIASDWRLQ